MGGTGVFVDVGFGVCVDLEISVREVDVGIGSEAIIPLTIAPGAETEPKVREIDGTGVGVWTGGGLLAA